MVRTLSVMGMLIAGVTMGAPIVAQEAQPPAPVAQPRPLDRSDLSNQIYVMEGALARAVSAGATRLNREIRSVVPEMVVLAGEPEARGVYLEGYGVYFTVGVPILRQSMVWSLRNMLDQTDNKNMVDSIAQLKQLRDLNRGADPRARLLLEEVIAKLESQVSPMPGDPQRPLMFPPVRQVGSGSPGDTLGAAMVLPDSKATPQAPSPAGGLAVPQQSPPPVPQTAEAARIDRMFLQDPGRAYTESVQRALIEAMIDYSLPMAIGPDEWLTVGARDNMQRDTLAPADPFEQIVTILLRIKGSDLAAYRAAQIDRNEIRRRVQIKEF